MAGIIFTLEIDRDTGALLNILNRDGSPAAPAAQEQHKWNMRDIHISVPESNSSTPTSPDDCPPGYCPVIINNVRYCVPC